MITASDLTIGQVAAFIAAAATVVKLLMPNLLPLLFLGTLQENGRSVTATAISWSVIGQFLQTSHWPTILRVDPSASKGVLPSVKIFKYIRLSSVGLLTIATVVTPLGLYESITARNVPTLQDFHYIKDPGVFGYGTAPRRDIPWSRICGDSSPRQCPNSNNNITVFDNATRSFSQVEGSYDTRVQQSTVDLFSSGLESFSKSVSSIFDIQWRSWTWAPQDTTSGAIYDNGSTYPVGAFRTIASVVLNNKLEVVEGLVVDTVNGGIGFRNHSAPPHNLYGSTWSEDLLFVQPVTQCVNTNLTIEFSLPLNTSQSPNSGGVTNIRLTDRGGFSNINRTFPRLDWSDKQNKPELWMRAYKAAWMNNVYSMAFLNVTNTRDSSDPNSHVFQYLNSFIGKEFPLAYPDGYVPINYLGLLRPNSMGATEFGSFLDGADQGVPGSNSSGSLFNSTNLDSTIAARVPLYLNPFNITSSNFSDASMLCEGSAGQDFANITNFAAKCGLVWGIPQRTDGVDDIMFLPGSEWTTPIYSCISVVQGIIKTVSFRFNGSYDLSDLEVLGIQDKTYPNDDAKPLWGVENTEIPLGYAKPLWGLVSPGAAAKATNISTLRKDSLLIPGYSVSAMMSKTGYQNLPGVDFPDAALSDAYYMNSGSERTDYTGASNLAMFRFWKNLSASPDSTAKIFNLVWTDIATNAVVGTKSLAPAQNGAVQKRDAASAKSNAAAVPVTTYHRQIKYRLPYAIPAVMVFAFLLVSAVLTSYAIVLGRTGLHKMRRYLNTTSAGRLMISNVVDNDVPTKSWIRDGGTIKVTVGRSNTVLANDKGEDVGKILLQNYGKQQ